MRLIRATLAAALLALLASSTAAAVEGPGPSRFQLEKPIPVERVQQGFSLSSGGGLSVAVTESCGAAPNDGVIVGGQDCAITITVTDQQNQPVIGAALVSTALPVNAVTNPQGEYSATVNLSSLAAAVYVDASFSGATGQTYFYKVPSGSGILVIDMKDRNGAAITTWSAAVTIVSPTWYNSTGYGLSVSSGTGRVVATADLGNGEGYVLHATGVEIPNGGLATVTLDGQNSHPIQAALSVNDDGAAQNVDGAVLFATKVEDAPISLRSGVRSNSSGSATVYVTPGTYNLAALGGNPGIFAEAAGVTVTTQAVAVPLQVESALSLNWSINPPTTPTEQKLIVTGTLGGLHPLIQAQAITLHMAPGSYLVETDLDYDLPDQLWTYQLLHRPSGVDFDYGPASYQSGISYSFTDVGPWDLVIGGPARIEAGQTGTYPLRLAGANAIIDWVDGIDWESFAVYGKPDVTVTSAGGDILQDAPSWAPEFSPGQNGIYYVNASLAVPGPFFAQNTTFASSRKIGVGIDPDVVVIQVQDPDGDLSDGVVIADGQSKLIQVTVQKDGGPVSGAEVYRGANLLGTTDLNGLVEFSLESATNQVIPLRVATLGDDYANLVTALPGWAWVEVTLTGLDGQPATGVRVFDQNQVLQFGSDGTLASGFVLADDASLIVVADPAPGLGYYYQITPTLQAGQSNGINVDAQVPAHEIRRQVLASTPTGLATGAKVHLQGIPVAQTDGLGRIKLYLNSAGPYELAITSTQPRLLSIITGVVPSATWSDLDLQDQATGLLAFEASNPAGGSAAGVMSANLWGSPLSYEVGDPGTYRVATGTYSFTADVRVTDQAGDLWTYHFVPRSPGLVRAGGLLMEPGKLARFDIGGPLAPVLTTGVSEAQPTSSFQLLNASNALHSITRQGVSIHPELIWSKIGSLDRVHASLTQTGPLFGSQSFEAQAVIDWVPAGNSLSLELPRTVGPGGSFRVGAVTTVAGMTNAMVEILFQPAALTLNLAQSQGGGSVTLPEPGRAVWTGGPDLNLDLLFSAVPGYHGETVIGLGAGTAVSTSGGAVLLQLGDSLLTVAKNKVEVAVTGVSTQASAAVAITTDTASVGTFDPDSSKHSFYDLAYGPVQILGSASGYLSASTTQTVPEFGSATVPDLDLRWGDLNGDHQVNLIDLDLIAARMNGKTAFTEQVNAGGPGLDILDLITAARNLGSQGDQPTSVGTLNLLLTTPGLTGQSMWIQAMPTGSAGASSSALIDLGTDAQTRETSALLNLPVGSYQVTVQVGDGLALHSIEFTVHIMHGLTTKVYASYE